MKPKELPKDAKPLKSNLKPKEKNFKLSENLKKILTPKKTSHLLSCSLYPKIPTGLPSKIKR